MRKALLGIFIGLMSVLLGVLIGAPLYGEWKIESTYPGVTVDDVDIEWLNRRVVIQGIQIKRGGIEARFGSALVSQGLIELSSGEVSLVLLSEGTELPAASDAPGSGIPLVARDIDFYVQKGDIKARASVTRVDDKELCFKMATAVHPQGTLHATNGCVLRDKSAASAESVVVVKDLPFAPKMAPGLTLGSATAHRVKYQDRGEEGRTVTAEEVLVGDSIVASHVVVQDAGKWVYTDAGSVTIEHPWVAPYPMTFESVGVYATKGDEESFRLRIGGTILDVDLKAQGVAGGETCSDWMSALPRPLPKAMEGMAPHLTGNLTFDVRTEPVPSFKLLSGCKFKCSESPIREIRQRAFTYEVYDAKNNIVERQLGPGTALWTSIDDLPPHVTRAFILLEDPGFESHRGVLAKALENSLKMNLESGEFTRGGSTITMQLAKNLWLRRHKTLVRKAQEAMLTYALESCMSKAQILEMYLNAIEFAPGVYGISAGSKYHFNKPPSQLTAEEAFYLAMILPSPRKALPPKAGGLDRAKRIMRQLAESGFISELMIDDGTTVDTSEWEVAP